MRIFIVCLLLGALVGVTPPPVSAQQNQTPHHSAQDVEDLKKRVSVLEKQLRTVENVEKMELQTNLAEANAKLLNSEFGKFKRELKDSNDEWLGKWSERFVITLVSIIGTAVAILIGVGASFGYWLKSRANQLIADKVEESLNGFKDALKELGILKNQLRVLEKEHSVSILEAYLHWSLQDNHRHTEPVRILREETLLDLLMNGRYDDVDHDLKLRYKAAEILAARKSTKIVAPILELINSVVDSDSSVDFETENCLCGMINLLARTLTPDAYQGLKRFLNRLLTENPKHKDTFLVKTVLAFGYTGIELEMRDSVSILKSAMTHFQQPAFDDLSTLVEYFDRFKDSAGIKEILTKHVTSGMPEVKEQCLTVLEKYDPEFVEKWRAENTTDDTESA